MTEISIPNEALEAAIAAAIDAEPNIRDQLHAACQALLRAWPGIIETEIKWKHLGGAINAPSLILPLPTENTND